MLGGSLTPPEWLRARGFVRVRRIIGPHWQRGNLLLAVALVPVGGP